MCGKTVNLEEHHIFGGTGRRDLSDLYDLKVDLCARCHREGPDAAHRSAETMQLLHEYGQRKAMHDFGWTAEEFAKRFWKNYVDAEGTRVLQEERVEAPADPGAEP